MGPRRRRAGLRPLAFVLSALTLVSAQSGAATDVWLDADVAAGLHERDVDDALALIQAFHSPELNVRGVSAVYGNAPLADGLPIAREVVERFGAEGLTVPPGAASKEDLGRPTEATRAMAAALRAKPLTILALGPLTNVATLVQRHPELHDAIQSIVIVAARRPHQRFNYPAALDAAFPDFNFENDPEAMRILLESNIDLVFTPWEVSSHVWITPQDLARLDEHGGSGAWIAEKSQSWIAMWRRRFDLPGFNPFDTLAVGWATHPHLMKRVPVEAWIEEGPNDRAHLSDQEPATKPYLLVRPRSASDRSILYAYRPDEAFTEILLQRLAGPVRPESN